MNILETFWRLLQKNVVGPTQWYEAILYGVVFLVASWIGSRSVKKLAERILEGDREALFDRTSFQFLTQLMRVGVYLFFGILYLHSIPSLRATGTAVLASVSVLSIVVGLAAQGALSNFIAGVALLVYRPFRVGDVLRVGVPGGSEEGVVESLTLGFTSLQMPDGRKIVVPNSQMNTQTFLWLRRDRQKGTGS